MPPADKQMFKLLLLGDSAVGKTSLQLQYIDGTFTDTYNSTMGLDFRVKNLEVDGEQIGLMVTDTPNPDILSTLTTTYYKNTHGVMLIYDITDRTSFNCIQSFLEEVKSMTPEDVPKILVGNKCDQTDNREIDYDIAKQFATEEGMLYIETSAKDDTNVEQAFTMLAAAAKNMMDSRNKQKDTNTHHGSDTAQQPSRCCCLL